MSTDIGELARQRARKAVDQAFERIEEMYDAFTEAVDAEQEKAAVKALSTFSDQLRVASNSMSSLIGRTEDQR